MHLPRSSKSSPGMPFTICLVAALLCSVLPAQAQNWDHPPDYTSIVIFGDSLSDAGNVAHLTEAKYGVRIPSPVADYTDGRFTDGFDTLPPAQKHFGVWVEQLAAMLPAKPEIKDSLDGGTDYAYGFATTGGGRAAFTFGSSNQYFVKVDNVGQQITDYLATHPRITKKTLFIVWGGAIDILYAKSSDDVTDAAIRQVFNIERLIEAGGTQFIVPDLPPLGLVPRLNGSPLTSIPATQASEIYNEILYGGVSLLRDLHHGRCLELLQLNVFSLFNKIVASPAKYSFADVTGSSQGHPVNPDTYLFWDDLHPTTQGHHLLSCAAAKLIPTRNWWERHEECGTP